MFWTNTWLVVDVPLRRHRPSVAFSTNRSMVTRRRRRSFFIGWFVILFLYRDANSFVLRLDPTTQSARQILSATNDTTTASLGDIMSETISMPQSNSLQETYQYFQNPLDRMILTANGNVQRLISSYYDTPVQLRIIYCTLRASSHDHPIVHDDAATVWDRQVELSIYQDHVFCRATSEIIVHDPTCRLTEIGIAQFFRYYNILPHFTLHAAGALATDHGGFWRRYTLSCPQLTCHIREEFPAGLWNITRPS